MWGPGSSPVDWCAAEKVGTGRGEEEGAGAVWCDGDADAGVPLPSAVLFSAAGRHSS